MAGGRLVGVSVIFNCEILRMDWDRSIGRSVRDDNCVRGERVLEP